MTRPGLTLVISTPLSLILQADDLRSVRAEDESGSFGIWPGHVPLLTVLRACIVRWRQVPGTWAYCAVRGGVMTVAAGGQVRIACRQGILGTDLAALEVSIARQSAIEEDAARVARVQRARMHTQAIRQIMRHIGGGDGGPGSDAAIEGLFE